MNIVQTLAIVVIGLSLVTFLYFSVLSHLPTPGVHSMEDTIQVVDVFSSVEDNKQRLCFLIRGNDLNGLRVFVGEKEVEYNIDCKLGRDCLVCSYLTLPEGKYLAKISAGDVVVQKSVVLPKVPVPPSVLLGISSPKPTSSGTLFDYYLVNTEHAAIYSVYVVDDQPGMYVYFDCEGDQTYEYESYISESEKILSFSCTYPSADSYTPTVKVRDVEDLVTEQNLKVAFIDVSTPVYSNGNTGDLSFSPPGENRYYGKLFYGDYNRVYISVSGPYADYVVYGTCVDKTVATGSSLTIQTFTSDYGYACAIDYNISVNGITEHFFSQEINVYRYYECSDESECESDLNSALSTKPAVVLLKSDISATIDLNGGNYDGIILDGNGHSVTGLTILIAPSLGLTGYPPDITNLSGSSLETSVEENDCYRWSSSLGQYVPPVYISYKLMRSSFELYRQNELPVKTLSCSVTGPPLTKIYAYLYDSNVVLANSSSPDYTLEDDVNLILSCDGSGNYYFVTDPNDYSSTGAVVDNKCNYVSAP